MTGVACAIACDAPGPTHRRLAGFAGVEAGPGETVETVKAVEAVVDVPACTFEIGDEQTSR